MERIFVQIASYRDPELRWTIQDLFDKAAHPDRVSVGICLHRVPEEDQACEPEALRTDQVQCVKYPALDSQGACSARSITQSLWEREEFTLQIDSHTRFVPGWDCKMLDTLASCPSEKAILSNYPPPYFPPDLREEGYQYLLMPDVFDQWGTLQLRSIRIPFARAPKEPVLGALCGGCFLFGPTKIIADVPYDPHLYFIGEEISLSVRLWTHGWDIYHPSIPLLYHYWRRVPPCKPAHWDDVSDWETLDLRSRRRVNHLLGVQLSGDPKVREDLKKYGLGTARSLKAYEKFSGIDFATRTAGPYRCRAGELLREWQEERDAEWRQLNLW